jgi:hypothetical protein
MRLPLRTAPLLVALGLLGTPGLRVGAMGLPVNPYDAQAAFAEELADRAAAVVEGEGAATLAWVDGRLAAEPAPEQVTDLLALRYTALTEMEPLPEGYRGEFIGRVAPGAMLADVETGVPASVSIAQAIVESGWGRSAPGNNLFGMKGVGPEGSERRGVVEYHKGKRYRKTANFRRYANVEASILDHARVLSKSPRYAEARAVSDDPAAYARALQGRYATDPRYAEKLDTIRALYGLDRFDWSPPPTAGSPAP